MRQRFFYVGMSSGRYRYVSLMLFHDQIIIIIRRYIIM